MGNKIHRKFNVDWLLLNHTNQYWITTSHWLGNTHRYLPSGSLWFGLSTTNGTHDEWHLWQKAFDWWTHTISFGKVDRCSMKPGLPALNAFNIFQTMFVSYSQQIRNELLVPQEMDTDFRAACICHRKVVDIGHVCSVCLSSMFSWSLFKITSSWC